MTMDWTNVAIVLALFAGVVMAVLSAAAAASDFHRPVTPNRRRQDELMAMFDDMHQKATLARQTLRQLSMMQEIARFILAHPEAYGPGHRAIINRPDAGVDSPMAGSSGMGKRR